LRLVVGDPGARGIGDGHPAGAVDIHDPRYAQHAGGVEGQRIEKLVVDTAIEHVDRLVTAGRAHREASVDDAQVTALDQLRAHLVGEEGVLEIGRIVDARGQHRDHRPLLAAAGRRFGRAGG
jgi:hypothetical protein